MATLIPALGACLRRMTPGEKRLAERLEDKLDDSLGKSCSPGGAMRAPSRVMDFATITQFGGALAALVPLVLIAGFAIVMWRTVSLHTLLRRL